MCSENSDDFQARTEPVLQAYVLDECIDLFKNWVIQDYIDILPKWGSPENVQELNLHSLFRVGDLDRPQVFNRVEDIENHQDFVGLLSDCTNLNVSIS